MILGTGCLAQNALDGDSIVDALSRTGLQTVLLQARNGARAADLRRVPAMGVQAAWDLRSDAVATAAAAGTGCLVLDLPEDMDLETACRSLFDLTREVPGLTLGIRTPGAGPLADPEALGLMLEDLGSLPLGYWHRPSRAHLLGIKQATWFERLGGHLQGLFLDDVRDGEGGLPPGIGELDLGATAELSARSIHVVLDIDPIPDIALLRVAIDNLLRLGFT